MSDNKINFGVEFGGEGFQKAAKMLESSIKGLDGSAKGVEKSFSSAFGDSTLRSLTAITTKFEKLSAIIQKISSQSYGLGQAMSGVGGPGGIGGGPGGAPNQIPIYDANGNVMKTISTTPSGGGGNGGGGSGANGGNSPTPPPAPGMDPMSLFFKSKLMGQGVGAIKEGFDFLRPYGGLDLQLYQRSQYGLNEALHRDVSKRSINQAFGNGTAGDYLSAAMGSIGSAIPAAAAGFMLGGPGMAMMSGGLAAASSFIPGLNKARDTRYQQFENYTKSGQYAGAYIRDMNNAEQMYGREGMDAMMSGAAIYGDDEARAAIQRNRRFGARGGINVGLAAEQRYGMGGLAESAAFSGHSLDASSFNLAKGGMANAGYSTGRDLSSIENISNVANQYNQNSGMGLRGDEIANLQSAFFSVAGAGRAAGLSTMEQGQALQAGQNYGKGLLGSTVGYGKAYSTLKAQGASDLEAMALINANVFTMNTANASSEFKRLTGKKLDTKAFRAGVKDLYETGYNALNIHSEHDKMVLDEVRAGSRVGGLGIQGMAKLADMSAQTPTEREEARTRGKSVGGTRETRDQEYRKMAAAEVQGLVGDLSNAMEDFSRIIPQAAEEFMSKINGERGAVKHAQKMKTERENMINKTNKSRVGYQPKIEK